MGYYIRVLGTKDPYIDHGLTEESLKLFNPILPASTLTLLLVFV
jgi:hypothetical protein